MCSPSLILLILKSLANISSSRICGESIAGTSSCSRMVFLWMSIFISPTPWPPVVSSVERMAGGSVEKPWLKAHEPLLSPWSGNLYKQGVSDPRETSGVCGKKMSKWEFKGDLTLSERYWKQHGHCSPVYPDCLYYDNPDRPVELCHYLLHCLFHPSLHLLRAQTGKKWLDCRHCIICFSLESYNPGWVVFEV